MDDAWPLSDRVEAARGKHHLRKKDFEAYREGSKYVMEHNDAVLSDMRQENKDKRNLFLSSKTGDGHVIHEVFKDDKKSLLVLERKNADGARYEMTQRSMSQVNALNLAKYQRIQMELKLQNLRDELGYLQRDNQEVPEVKQANKTYTLLENEMDKATIKKNTALLITKQYREIYDHLHAEYLAMPGRLTRTENALRTQKRELQELRAMEEDAKLARDNAREMLAQHEEKVYEDMQKRAVLLQETRQEVERRRIEQEQIEKRNQRNMLLAEPGMGQSQDSVTVCQTVSNQKTIFTYQDAFLKIKMASHEADVEGVVQRVISEKETLVCLKQRVQDLEEQITKMKEEKEEMCEQYRVLRFSGGAKLSRGEIVLEEMKQRVEEAEERKQQQEDDLRRYGGCLISIKSGINTLLEKLRDVKLPSPQHNFTHGDALDQMQLCVQKIEQLLRKLEGGKTCEALSRMNSTALDSHVDAHLPAADYATRMHHLKQLQRSDNYDQCFDQDEEGVLTAADIKKQGQAIIDAKVKPRRMRKAKK